MAGATGAERRALGPGSSGRMVPSEPHRSDAVTLQHGASYLGLDRCLFRVWAPAARRVELRLSGADHRVIGMEPLDRGYHQAIVDRVPAGASYSYGLDGGPDRPDPASRHQPDGVHGSSAVVDPAFEWSDAGWTGLQPEHYVFYELHVGTFTAEGTFDAIIPHLDRLADLGMTAIELMPVAQFPGERNWGYDGAAPWAVQTSYGGPPGLKRLVDACHARGIAVALDVVYNHLGPEGNYLSEFGPYFTDRYRTPWGAAVNLDDAGSDEVRRYFIENALHWIAEYHIDALRLDAVHALYDSSAKHFLEELGEAVHALGRRLNRRVHLIAESDLNDPRLITSRELGGYGLDAQWTDDFHHCVHALLTGESDGYYAGFGRVSELVRMLRQGYTFTGQYSSYRGRRHGRSPAGLPARRFVVFTQNHDQTGNRMRGERLSELVPFPALKLAAGILLLSPYVPLLFMGQEYGERARFPYFISHGDPELVEAVRQGRAGEFAAFSWRGEPPDPQDPATFRSAVLDHGSRERGKHAALLALYRELLRLRRELPALAVSDASRLDVIGFERPRVLFMHRYSEATAVVAVFNFDDEAAELVLPVPPGRWHRLIDSEDDVWEGSGSRASASIESPGAAKVGLGPLSFTALSREY